MTRYTLHFLLLAGCGSPPPTDSNPCFVTLKLINKQDSISGSTIYDYYSPDNNCPQLYSYNFNGSFYLHGSDLNYSDISTTIDNKTKSWTTDDNNSVHLINYHTPLDNREDPEVFVQVDNFNPKFSPTLTLQISGGDL